ncbi:MAG: translation initiation factor IF-2 [Elusimicrobia bacterium]|nr:translation initiation factor IF-2 [Elusimicrobiota bacterium]
MEKKKTTDKPEDKLKTKPAAVKKPASEKPKKAASSKSGGKKKKEELDVKRVAMEKRATQDKDSIAPPTQHLVDAFSLLKGSSAQRRAPTVTRLPAGGAPARPPQPAPAAPAVPPKPAASPAPAPAPAHAAPVPAPVAKASPAAPAPAAPAPKPATAPVVPVAKPAVPAPASPVPAKPASPAPAPAARPPAASPARPSSPTSAPHRPGQHPPRPGQHSHGRPQHSQPKHPAAKPAQKPSHSPEPARAESASPALKPLKVTTQVTVRELAEKMAIKVNDLIKKLMGLGVFATINQRLDPEAAILAAHEFGYELEVAPMPMEAELALKPELVDKPELLKPRAPVVTIMGHVDHGKTSLLDAIRQANVAGGESGGITQHIGAYKVRIPKGEIAFLDTPGHEAFTAMRARGAKVTDIVILVVSAADGVMPQTIEAIDHAKAAGVPIVVAVNKVDLPTAQPQKIRQELSSHGLLSEEWGGKNIFVDVSAKKKLNLEKLLEMLLIQAEMMELKANPDRPGVGIVLEARLDQKKGNVATLLVQNGTVKVGDSFVAGVSSGKIKALLNDQGERIQVAGPSTPVEILGLSGTPQAGDIFSVVSSERQAKEIAEKRSLLQREEALAHKKHMSLVGFKSELARGAKELRIVLKADVQGSIQAIRDSLEKMSTNEISVNLIHAGVGNVNESDVLLAGASDAVTLTFHADIEPRAQEVVDRTGVEVRRYEIIYDLLADVKAAMEGLLEPEIVDVVAGRLEVRQVFNIRRGKIAGCFVREGKAVRSGSAKIVRGGQSLGESKIDSLKRFKDDVSEVEKGMECGVSLTSFKDFQVGDVLEIVVKEKRTRRLESAQ